MFLLLNLYDYAEYNIFYGPKKSNMIMDGTFTKIIYSNEYITLYGLFLDLPVTSNYPLSSTIDISYFHKDTIRKLTNIECHLLETYRQFMEKKNITKNPIYCLHNQIETGCLKYYKEHSYVNPIEKLYIKISGIWENDRDFGITFKIIQYSTN